MPGGALPTGIWTKAVWGWGYFSVDYALQPSVACDYNCYVGIVPFAVSAGTAEPGHETIVTHRVIVYGDIWLRAHGEGTYELTPVGPSSPLSGRLNAALRRGPVNRATGTVATAPAGIFPSSPRKQP